ncbi:MAG: glycosyltransferase [Limnohabitans sp.]|uniref:glycosyltransferase n=1 Tax=Limnohabitans sp. TaxID=1907725 RepID=UPI00391AA810
MKVLYIVESLDNRYGGPARSVPSIALSLKNSHGVDSVLLSVSKNTDEKNEVIDNSDLIWIKCKLFGPAKLMFSFGMLKRLLDPDFVCKFDVIHLNNLWNFPSLFAWYSAQKFRIPLIISPRGSIYKWSLSQGIIHKRIALMLYQKKMLKQAALIHVTDLSEREALKDLGINTKHLVIPNGINSNPNVYEIECADCVLQNNIYNNRRKILFVGRIHKKKGLDLLVSAFSELLGIFPDWDLHIVGAIEDDDYIDFLKKLVSDSAASNRIIFHGEFVGSEKIKLFRSSNLFVLPSHSENFGISVAEAMACGLPIITTNNTPWKDLDKINAGWSIDLSIENLKNSLKCALNLDDVALKVMGRNGSEFIKRYDWKFLSVQYRDMYRSVSGV